MAVIILSFSLAVLYKDWTGGVTVDEPGHLVSAHVLWHGGYTLWPKDMPPLIRIVGGWPTRLYQLPLPAGLGERFDSRLEWNVALDMMAGIRDPLARHVFFWARAGLLLFAIGVLGLVWWWARGLFGPFPAIAAAAALSLEPTFRAQSSIFKNDVAASLGYLATWYALWRFWESPARKWALIAGLSCAMGILAKLSMLVLVPISVGVIVARLRRDPRTAAGLAVAAVLIPYLMLLAAYPREVRRLRAGELAQAALNHDRVPGWMIRAGNVFRVVPVATPAWEGILALTNGSRGSNPVFLLGTRRERGSPLYFVTAVAVKALIPILALAAAGLWILLGEFNRKRAAVCFLLLPGALYFCAASLSSLQYGIRLVLPCLPFAILIAAAGAGHIARIHSRRVLALFGVWIFLQSLSIFPSGLTYFNEFAGGPPEGLRYLADSNLDWGQSLPELAAYARANGIRKLRLSYFGTDNPDRYFQGIEWDRVVAPWSPDLVEGRTRIELQPGYHAASASLLPGHYFEAAVRDYFQPLRDRRPIARAGNGIYVYHIPEPMAEGRSHRPLAPAK